MCGEKLKELRGKHSQQQIANAIGITKSAWAMYERNERTPRDEIKIRIANFFGKSVQEIFFRQQYVYLNSSKKYDGINIDIKQDNLSK